MRTLIIDNYLPNSPQIEHLYNIIKDITVHTVEVKAYTSLGAGESFDLYDIIILSGSQRKLAEPEVFESYAIETAFLREINKPILGICFGHQLIAMTFGENVVTMDEKIEGYYMVNKLGNDKIFEGIDEKFLVMESHEEMVENVPFDFILLANSPNCPVEAMRHERLPLYGLQFHPERFDDIHPTGGLILKNFFGLATL